MPLQVVNTIVSVSTLLLLGTSVVAGIVLLRHMRAGNELSAVLALERDFRRPELQAALGYVANDLAARLEDPIYRAQLGAPGYIDPRRHPEMVLCNWFDRAGALIRGRYLGEAIFLNSFDRLVSYYWSLLAPAIAVLRRTRGSGEYAGFEYLAHLAQARQAHRRSTRAARRPRPVPVADPWLTEDRRLRADQDQTSDAQPAR